MITNKLAEQAWVLYQASLKNSTELKEWKKWNDEHDQLERALDDGVRELDDCVYSEVAINLLNLLMMLFRTYQPKTFDDARETLNYMFEFVDDEYNSKIEKGRAKDE